MLFPNSHFLLVWGHPQDQVTEPGSFLLENYFQKVTKSLPKCVFHSPSHSTSCSLSNMLIGLNGTIFFPHKKHFSIHINQSTNNMERRDTLSLEIPHVTGTQFLPLASWDSLLFCNIESNLISLYVCTHLYTQIHGYITYILTHIHTETHITFNIYYSFPLFDTVLYFVLVYSIHKVNVRNNSSKSSLLLRKKVTSIQSEEFPLFLKRKNKKKRRKINIGPATVEHCKDNLPLETLDLSSWNYSHEYQKYINSKSNNLYFVIQTKYYSENFIVKHHVCQNKFYEIHIFNGKNSIGSHCICVLTI